MRENIRVRRTRHRPALPTAGRLRPKTRPSGPSRRWSLRTPTSKPPSCRASAAASTRSSTRRAARNCSTATPCSSRPTSPSATPGSPAASSGTSAAPATGPAPAPRCTRPASKARTVRRSCGSGSGSAPATSSSSSTSGSPRTRNSCTSVRGSRTRRANRSRRTGGRTSPSSRRRGRAYWCRRSRPGSTATATGSTWSTYLGRTAIDLSYPMNHRRAIDFFFEPLPEQRPWIAALDAEGNGLVQTSTERLRGRKMFVWGRVSAAGAGRSGCRPG